VRHVGLLALLVTLWILAWGQLTVANVLSGIVVAGVLLLAFPRRRRPTGRVHLSAGGLVRLGAYVATQLVTSNVMMTRQILQRARTRHPGVLAHHLRQPSPQVATAMSSIIALSPGTMTVDVTGDSSVLYVHFFDLDDIESARAALARLDRLVTNAIATPRSGAPERSVNQEPT